MPIVYAIVSIFGLLVGSVLQPVVATCPRAGFYTAGVFRDGFILCTRPFGCVEHRTVHGGWISDCQGSDDVVERVYCTGGSIPVTNNGIVVSCQARH